jgi:hypothetical protein
MAWRTGDEGASDGGRKEREGEQREGREKRRD